MLSPRFIPESVFYTRSVVCSPQSVFFTDRFPTRATRFLILTQLFASAKKKKKLLSGFNKMEYNSNKNEPNDIYYLKACWINNNNNIHEKITRF